jgi:trimeric autotransporter adhesin
MGTFGYSGDGGLAVQASLSSPGGMAVDLSGNLFIADVNNNRVRVVTKSNGIITTFAGSGNSGYSGDGIFATAAQLYSPSAVAIDSSGKLYIADSSNYRIRLVTTSSGSITTYVGTGMYGYSGDGGPATLAQLTSTGGIAVDASGNLFITDIFGHRVRIVMKTTGNITTYAGTGTVGSSGDGGQATLARLNNPQGVTIDASGNLYIADTNNHRIRLVTKSTGIITTVAGIGSYGYSGDGGPATQAQLNFPQSTAVDSSGKIYIADFNNNRIRLVTKSTGIITTYAGNSTYGYSGDGGLATRARLYHPRSVVIDTSGNVFVSDGGNNVIRVVSHYSVAPTGSPALQPSPPSTSTPAPSSGGAQTPKPAPVSVPTPTPTVGGPTATSSPITSPSSPPQAKPTVSLTVSQVSLCFASCLVITCS